MAAAAGGAPHVAGSQAAAPSQLDTSARHARPCLLARHPHRALGHVVHTVGRPLVLLVLLPRVAGLRGCGMASGSFFLHRWRREPPLPAALPVVGTQGGMSDGATGLNHALQTID